MLLTVCMICISCRQNEYLKTEYIVSGDGTVTYCQTSKGDDIISRSVTSLDVNGRMISKLYLDPELKVMYYDEFNGDLVLYRYKANGEIWIDFTDKYNNAGVPANKGKWRNSNEALEVISYLAYIAMQSAGAIKGIR